MALIYTVLHFVISGTTAGLITLLCRTPRLAVFISSFVIVFLFFSGIRVYIAIIGKDVGWNVDGLIS